MFAVMTIGLGAASAAFAQATPPDAMAPASLPDEQGFRAQLDRAKARYFSSDMIGAASLLEDLWDRMRHGEDPGTEARRETMTFLCEIRYRQSALEVAESTVRWLLKVEPDATISPFHHPREVVSFFDTIRRQVELERQEELLKPTRRPPPVWTFLPLGIPQARQGRTGAAVVYGGLQVAFGATALATRVHAKRIANVELSETRFTDEQLDRRIPIVTYGVVWPTTLLFYSTWGLSVLDGIRHRGEVTSPSEPNLVLVPIGPRGTTGFTATATLRRRRR